MSKISIIVPVYNAEEKIKKCLNSIVEQNDKDIEAIIINDGSIDNSEETIIEYIDKHPDIFKYYKNDNMGVANTRNFGIEKAHGDYILFIDSDDYIDSTTLKKIKTYIDDNIDMIKFKLQRVDEKSNLLEKVDGPVFEKVTGEEAFNKLYSEDVLLDSPCIYVIKRKLFTDNNFKFQRTYHEDFGLIPLIILKSESFISLPYYLYYYVQAKNSITRCDDYNKTIKKVNDVLYHYDNAMVEIDKMKLNKQTKENAKIFYTNAVVLKINELKEKDRIKFIKEIKKRKVYKNIKPRNYKQIIKRCLLKFNIRLYLKIR